LGARRVCGAPVLLLCRRERRGRAETFFTVEWGEKWVKYHGKTNKNRDRSETGKRKKDLKSELFEQTKWR